MDNESNLDSTLTAIDARIKQQETVIERGKALERLKLNKDFQLVILEGYLDSEARRLFSILTDPTGASPYTDEMIHRKLVSISDFKGYVGTDDFVGTVELEAQRAPIDIQEQYITRKELTAEGAM